MPFKSKKQRAFLEAVVHDPEFAKKSGVKPESVEGFVKDAEKAPQPKVKYAKLKEKLKK